MINRVASFVLSLPLCLNYYREVGECVDIWVKVQMDIMCNRLYGALYVLTVHAMRSSLSFWHEYSSCVMQDLLLL
jgi:hypothetical protein